MTTTSTEEYRLGGGAEPLNTLGYNMDLADSLLSGAVHSPRHQLVPSKPGAAVRHRPRILPAQNELSFWVSTRDADGVDGGRSQLYTNIDLIMPLLAVQDLITIQKTRDSETGIITLNAEAEINGKPDIVERNSDKALQVVVPLVFPYPYWELSTLANWSGSGAGFNVTNVGHADIQKLEVQFEAGGSPWVDPEVTHDDLGWTLKLNDTVPASTEFVIHLWNGTAIDNAAASVTGNVEMTGEPMPRLRPGNNSMTSTQTSGSGTVRFLFNPAYLI